MTLQPVPGHKAGIPRAAFHMATPLTVALLARQVGLPQAPDLIDIRLDEDFALDPRLIPGSRRLRHEAIDDWPGLSPDRSVIIVCHRGKKLSQGAAALLRCKGLDAVALDGGFEAWSGAGMPTVNAGRVPPSGPNGVTRWVTRERPKIDRIACPWLIKRFIDRDAEILYVSATEVLAVAERFAATPFDMPETFWGHRGDQCTFDTMLAEFGLHTSALARMARIVRAADTARPDTAPEASGLLAIARGLSMMYTDDLAQLAASMGLYDALYRWCRDDQTDAGGRLA